MLSITQMGWWLNGSCNGGTGGQCVVNVTCQDMQKPSRAWGHRCACADEMFGDGFTTGDGCHYDDTPGSCGASTL